jgi:hypothetical protein
MKRKANSNLVKRYGWVVLFPTYIDKLLIDISI